MRFRFLLFTLVALAFSPPIFSQSLAKTFTLTAANQCAPIGTSGLPTIGIDVSGTFSLTLTPKVAINGAAQRASQVVPSNSNTPQATITAAGGYADPYVGGYDSFFLCVTSYSSGSVTILLNPSPALNASLFGGGGVSFADVTAGTNTNALVIGEGGSLETSGDGVIVATSCPSCAAGGLNISTAVTPNPPSPLYSPSETPASSNPYIFSQDVNGLWHTQAVIDTTTANGGTGNGPADPAGTLTWTRRTYFRDTGLSTQSGKNAFLSVNHNAQVGTLSSNQDRAIWVSMGNPSSVIGSFAITNNVVTFGTGNVLNTSYPWVSGQTIVATGLSVGTYLNNQALTILTATGNGSVWVITAAFTHANVGVTADSGSLDLSMYSMENLQMEMDLNGSPTPSGQPDAEYRTLSLQCSDNTTGTLSFGSPASGVGCLRASYSRTQASTGGNLAATWNVLLNMQNNSTTGTQGEVWENLEIQGNDTASPIAAQTGYHGIHFAAPHNSAFSRDHIAEVFDNWPTAAHSTFNKFIQQFGTGEIYYDGTHTVETADMAGQATVLATTTSIAVTFAINYLGTAAPVVNLTPVATSGSLAAIQTVLASGGPVVIYTGSANAWTGFSINIPVGAPTGGLTFNYTVAGTF